VTFRAINMRSIGCALLDGGRAISFVGAGASAGLYP
jgi:hypothetical protein